MYETFAAVVILIIGLLNILFPQKMLNLSKSSARKHKDSLNQYIANYPEKSGLLLARFIGPFFTIAAISKLFFGF